MSIEDYGVINKFIDHAIAVGASGFETARNALENIYNDEQALRAIAEAARALEEQSDELVAAIESFDE